MELTVTGDLARELLTRSKKDDKLAQAMARQFIENIEPAVLADYLLEPEIAVALLSRRFQQDPERTLQELQRLAAGGHPTGRRGKASRPGKAERGGAVRQRGRRKRLSAAAVKELKAQVKALLARHPWATRRQITEHVDLPTQAIYRRIMLELQQSGEIVGRGEKSKATYALKGSRTDGKNAPQGADKAQRKKARKKQGSARTKGARRKGRSTAAASKGATSATAKP